MRAADQMLSSYMTEIEERKQFIDGLVESANGKDLSDEQLELVSRAKDRIASLNRQMEPIEEARRISSDSQERLERISQVMNQKPPQAVEYRSAGDYALDLWRGGFGDRDARSRLEIYNRAASHQTTADNPGLIPTPILGPVVDFIDSNRPLVSALGPRQLPGQNWVRPKVTVHTSVALQSAEKAELVSQKMTIAKLTATAATYGGYVNVSRQDIDFTQPGVMDVVITDLAGQYAIQTEAAAATAFAAAATAGSTLPTGANTADQVSQALWAAAAALYTATKGVGTVFAVIPPGLLAQWGPMFPPVNPFNQQSPGFNAGNFSSGLMGQIASIPIYVSPAIATNTGLVLSSAAAEVYEDRIGSLQVVEPSVLGVQVAYAGYFTPLVIEPTGIIKITKTP
jgi:HK97 family phage major capsid protein